MTTVSVLKRPILVLCVTSYCAALQPAQAETLYDALCTAFAGNEVIGSQRAAIGVGIANKQIAWTGYLPAVNGNLDYGREDQKGTAPDTPTTDSKTDPRGFGVSLSQNLFNGFKTTNTVAREDASLQSERNRFDDVEQNILLDVVTAYADVIRDKAIIELRRRDHDILETRAKQTRFRFQIGDLTRTDVDQSDAALARSDADLVVAQTNLETSQAVFQSVVGHAPGKLDPPAVPERLLPQDLDSAISIAQTENPSVQSALNAVRAAEFNVDVEWSGLAPSLDVTASMDHRWDPDFYPVKTDLVENRVMGRLTIPLFDRGLTFTSVHKATELKTQRELQLDHARIQIRANVIQNRSVFLAAKTVIASADAQIAASGRALTGVELEQAVGRRTMLDVLNAQRSLLDAYVNREIAQHDRVIAGYRFLASVGRLSVSRFRPDDTRDRSPRLSITWRQAAKPPLERFLRSSMQDAIDTTAANRKALSVIETRALGLRPGL